MSLTNRLTTVGLVADAEDFLADSLAVIFPDDVMNQHGDASHTLHYASPHLRGPLLIELADPDEEDDRRLFGHYLWNASLMLAEFVEAGSLGLTLSGPLGSGREERLAEPAFDVRGLDTIELGAGTALPSVMAALLGARRVAVTDYPTPPIMDVLRRNVARNTRAAELSPLAPAPSAGSPGASPCTDISVYGHAWGVLDGEDADGQFARASRGAFDRVLVCDCLWMPWQHDTLRRSIAWFMRDGPASRAWVVAGFHTGRDNMTGFFDEAPLAAAGLEVEAIWERDVTGEEREWEVVRKDDSMRKRWLVVAVLKKRATGDGTTPGTTGLGEQA